MKDAFHSLRLSENSKRYYGILPYFSSSSYLYQRMSMGLNISSSIWQSYINAILDCLQSRKYCESIMDDLILFTPSKETHMNKLEDLLKPLLKNGWRYHQRSVNCLRPAYNTWEQNIYWKWESMCTTTKNRLEAIQKLQPPKTPKGCRSFAGVINFLSMFCPELQKLLKTHIWFNKGRKAIYLGKRTARFIWRNQMQINKTASFTYAK